MNPADLQIGDIIFFMDANKLPIHVAIYAGLRANTHYITHAVTGKYNSIITTRLKNDDFPYRVFRCHDMALAAQSAIRMRIWEEHRVPFSIEKHDLFSVLSEDIFSHPKTGGKDQLAFSREYFARNYYRYIEYASHPSMPYFPNGSQTQGMYCSEAITAAFNIQKLIMLDAINEAKGWVSDHTTKEIFSQLLTKFQGNKTISKRYSDYLESIRSEKPYPYGQLPSNLKLDQAPFLPSTTAWKNSSCTIEEFVDNYLDTKKFELPLDSILATPGALMSHVENDNENWTHLGELKIDNTTNPLDNLENTGPEEWRQHIAKLFATADEKRKHIIETYESKDSFKHNWQFTEPTQKPLKKTRSFNDVTNHTPAAKEKTNLLSASNKYQSIKFFVTPERHRTQNTKKMPSTNITRRNLFPTSQTQPATLESFPQNNPLPQNEMLQKKQFVLSYIPITKPLCKTDKPEHQVRLA